MTSVIGTAIARAPRNARAKNPQQQLSTVSKESTPSSGIFVTIPEVVGFIEKFTELYQAKNVNSIKGLQAAIPTLCANLKSYGHQLETYFKDVMDRLFICLRNNASKNEHLDKISRLLVMELIELRAGGWAINDELSSYYKKKLALLNSTESGTQFSPSTQKPQNFGNNNQLLDNTEFNEGSPPMLLPGETVKFSGKYSSGSVSTEGQQNKASSSNKTFLKGEVVIRNADSGKVMGIKGRRVHLIEEISDTVISFQRVNPGAKERLVQITAPAHDNIMHARQLIEQTILRNASPDRQLSEDLHRSSGESHQGQDQLDGDDFGVKMRNQQIKLNRQSSMLDTNLDEYQYTVNVGDQSIKIKGKNLEMVQMAKLALDDYFTHPKSESNQEVKRSNSSDDGISLSLPSSQLNSPRESDAAQSPKKINSLKYSRELLLMWSNSPLCLQPPTNFQLLSQQAPEILRKDCEPFDGMSYLKKHPERLVGSDGVVLNAAAASEDATD